jgi:hypothetical protein
MTNLRCHRRLLIVKPENAGGWMDEYRESRSPPPSGPKNRLPLSANNKWTKLEQVVNQGLDKVNK